MYLTQHKNKKQQQQKNKPQTKRKTECCMGSLENFFIYKNHEKEFLRLLPNKVNRVSRFPRSWLSLGASLGRLLRMGEGAVTL
jgi:hypothetical protein